MRSSWIPANPGIVYATTYQRRRRVGQLVGGGPESGIYKSADGGRALDGAHERPPPHRHGAHCPGHGQPAGATPTLLALIPAQEDLSGLYRSTDQGESWERIGEQESLGPPGSQERRREAARGGPAPVASQGLRRTPVVHGWKPGVLP